MGLNLNTEQRTTAQLRCEALELEDRLELEAAARLWDLAADRYPDPIGALAQRDITNMRERAAELRSSAS